jgi:hypothetical protein
MESLETIPYTEIDVVEKYINADKKWFDIAECSGGNRSKLTLFETKQIYLAATRMQKKIDFYEANFHICDYCLKDPYSCEIEGRKIKEGSGMIEGRISHTPAWPNRVGCNKFVKKGPSSVRRTNCMGCNKYQACCIEWKDRGGCKPNVTF